MTGSPLEDGRDEVVVLADGRRIEYWEGGDPAGRAVMHHPGTPVTRILGRWGHAAAVAAGVRLITLNRPGYGGSTPVPATYGLRGVGRDTVEVARLLGLESFGVTGSSGGGPFAIATAVAAPEAVRAVGLIGAVGPWRDLDAPDFEPEDRACLALADVGDVQGAFDCLLRGAREQAAATTPAAWIDGLFSGEVSAMTADPAYRSLWVENVELVRAQPLGYAFDNVAWGAAWDVAPGDVVAPAFLYYGGRDTHCPADRHGRWYADRLAHVAEMVVLPDAGHMEIIDGHWPEVLAGVLRAWT